MEVNFRSHSARAQQARIAAGLRPWVASLEIGAVMLFVGGIVALGFHLSLGWALCGIAILPAMVAEWYRHGLQELPLVKGGQRVDELLDGDILGLLPPQPTPLQIVMAASHTRSGQFFAARLGVGASFLEQLTSGNRGDTAALWDEVMNVYKQSGSASIHGGVVMMAGVRQIANHTSLLARLQLDDDDLLAGIKWYDRLQGILKRHKKHEAHPGGVGRDWSFGWIPHLSRFGTNISMTSSSIELEAHKEDLRQLVSIFGGNGRRNALLVGRPGSGKTEVMYAFANAVMHPDETIPESLRYRQLFLLDASSLISAAPERGALENLMTLLLNEAYAAKNIIVCLDNAQLFFENGVGSVDVSNILLPILSAGRLPLIASMDEQRYLQISKRSPEITSAMNRVQIQPANEAQTMAIMEDQLITFEYQYNVLYMYQALKEVYRLADRYIQNVAMPGRAIQLLESAANHAENGIVSAKSVRMAIERTMNVKVGASDDVAERDKLLRLEDLIHERMINQVKAVNVVSDALRRARAGVRNQNRPIGTFLFLGPTGVGKTELSKALAAVYFGGEDHLIRLDMNEFVQASDVQRLIADPADDPSSLTAQVMKQPFSVILLDEIEKAHSSVLTTLLQLLDEGIMRDVNNNEVNFRDSIVIATSNAGADRIREYIERGYKLEQFEQQFTDELINSGQFHPEFLNRFDEIILFTPLSKDDLLKVVDLILKDINKTMALQKVTVVVDDETKKYLVDAGYDPRLGARPMRRVIQRTVENTVAKQMLAGEVEPGGTIQITFEQVKSALENSHAANRLVAGEDDT